MAAFLWENGFLDRSKKHFSFRALQGDNIGRPGIVRVNMVIKDGNVNMIQIAGEAVSVIEGNIRLRGDTASRF
jgi:predicted PhzF superfamily epimerase YddE/YHI9